MTAASSERPLCLGQADEFTCVREFLRQAGFNNEILCRELGMQHMGELGRVAWDRFQPAKLPPPLQWCIQVFVRGLPVDHEESRRVCPEKTFDAFQSLKLLRPKKNDVSKLVCPVWLYPVDGFLIVSDRTTDPDGEIFKAAEDVVFPAIYGGTLRFLRLLPDARGGEALDLCGGTGIGALRLSRTARVAVTADVADRSAFFAEFNAALNGSSVASLCGDLYAPAADRKFDLITAHPPFVPATKSYMVYRDGGATGEEVTRRVIEGLPTHLRPGGTCVVLCVARDTQDQSFEQRAKEWLGEAKDEFDVVFGLEKILAVGEVVESLRARGQNLTDAEAREVFARLQSLGTKQFVYGALFISRHRENAVQKPYRIGLTVDGGASDFEKLLAWRKHCRRPGFAEWLSNCRPRFAPGLQLTALHRVREGELIPCEFLFAIENGFEARLRPDAWIVPLLASLNGRRTVREVFESAKQEEELPAGFGLEDFADLVEKMIGRGFFQVDLD